MNAFSRVATFALLLGAIACSKAPQQELKSVKVPPGFTFQTSRSVSLRLQGTTSTIPAGTAAKLTVARLDGKVLYSGALGGNGSAAAHLALPLKDNAVLATLLFADGRVVREQIPVVSNIATHTF